MLTVIAVIVVLSMPAFHSFVTSQRVASGAHDMVSFLEPARSEAVCRQICVWVGFTWDARGGSMDMVEGTVRLLRL